MSRWTVPEPEDWGGEAGGHHRGGRGRDHRGARGRNQAVRDDQVSGKNMVTFVKFVKEI